MKTEIKRTWWDSNHLFPKQLSFYFSRKLIHSTSWYRSGAIRKNTHITFISKTTVSFYPDGRQRSRMVYRYYLGRWIQENRNIDFSMLFHRDISSCSISSISSISSIEPPIKYKEI